MTDSSLKSEQADAICGKLHDRH